jgi:acetyl-CoA carboxylase biotin carboxyl carrier protein
MELTPDDVDDILALLDSLPYHELDLRTSRFRLALRRTPDGWTQSVRALSAPSALDGAPPPAPLAAPPPAPAPAAGQAGLVPVLAPLPGTFYRAPRPGAAPFVEVGSRVSEDTVVAIVETMKLMNPVHAGTGGRVAEICLGNGELAAHGAVLLRIEPDP